MNDRLNVFCCMFSATCQPWDREPRISSEVVHWQTFVYVELDAVSQPPPAFENLVVVLLSNIRIQVHNELRSGSWTSWRVRQISKENILSTLFTCYFMRFPQISKCLPTGEARFPVCSLSYKSKKIILINISGLNILYIMHISRTAISLLPLLRN